MALVSGLYRLAVTDGWIDEDEKRRRVKVAVRRLVAEFGKEFVVEKIRAFPVPEKQEVMKAWLVVEAWAAPEPSRAGTL